jgi:hypothetical protein
MGHKPLVPAALAALVLAGCGANSSSQSGPPQPQTTAGAERKWPLSDFLRLSGIRRDRDGRTYRLPDHPDCVTSVVLLSNADVQSYVALGDVVATNGDGSAGVKVDAIDPAPCRRLFTRALANVR